MKSQSLQTMRAQILSAGMAHGCFVREDNGREVEVSMRWAAPLIGRMSKSACHWVLLGTANRKDHTVILSRRVVNALQSFAEHDK